MKKMNEKKWDNELTESKTTRNIIAKKCTAIKKDGTPCNAIANSTGYCVAHREYIHGGSNVKNRLDQGNVHIKVFIARLIMSMKKGKIEPNVGNAIINGCKTLIEINNIEREDALFKELMDRVNKSTGNKQLQDVDVINMVE